MSVGVFYKWEDHNHGLEHKCGTCATVLSSPRAKKTCFGVHEEVCPAYHKTLHFIGASHKCAACSNTTKAHSKRHLEIAEIVQAINRLGGSSSTQSLLCNNKRKGKKINDSDPDPSDDGSVPLGGPDSERAVEWGSNASTLINDDDDAEERKQWSGGMESPDARKAAKAERKAAKNQVLFDIVTQDELAMVHKALHPESEDQDNITSKGQGLTDNRTIDENIAYTPNTVKWTKISQNVHAKKTAKNNGSKQRPDTLEQDKILSPIFARLGISTNVSKTNKRRKSLDAKLRAAILGDLDAYENDQIETMQRMAGYWRYANKRTYNEMVRNNKIWDWATGEKLPEIREEPELDIIEEEDESAEAAKTEERVPKSWDDPESELPINRNDSGTDTKLSEGVECIRDYVSAPKLSSNPGRLPSQNLSIEILAPSPGDDILDRLHAESKDHTKRDFETHKGSFMPRHLLPPLNSKPKDPHDKGFQGVKDTRILVKAVRDASPPLKDPAPHTPQPLKTFLLLTPQDKDTPDPLNRFGALSREVPAPCEEVKKVDSTPANTVIKFPGKPIVKTLVIHEDQGDWQTAQGSKGRKGAKGGPAVALRAVSVHAGKFVGEKASRPW